MIGALKIFGHIRVGTPAAYATPALWPMGKKKFTLEEPVPSFQTEAL